MMVTKGTEIDGRGCGGGMEDGGQWGLGWGQVIYKSVLIDCFRFILTLLEVIKQRSELKHHRKDR